jgi:hypothetical protein
MDPVTAIGLACNVLQLINSGIKIGTQIHEAYKYGTCSALDATRVWVAGILEIDAEIQQKTATHISSSQFDARIAKLAAKTAAQVQELKTIADKIALRAPTTGSQTSSFSRLSNATRQTFRASVKKGKDEGS